MTEKTQPTDAELWQLHMQLPGQHKDPIDFARSVLALWGQPARSGEPVAWKHDCAALLTNDVELWIDACPHCGKPRNAPQPVERVPLTDEQVAEGLAKLSRHMGLFMGGVRFAEQHHGIKGGQHGADI